MVAYNPLASVRQGWLILAVFSLSVETLEAQPCGGYAITDLGTLCASDCCYATFALGCSDPACEQAICKVDPFCCDGAWDEICAQQANELCEICGPTNECETSFFDFSSGVAINEAGQIAGFSRPSDFFTISGAWFWEDGVLTALPHLRGDNGSTAADINGVGQVMGTSTADILVTGYTAVVWCNRGGTWVANPVFTPQVSHGAAINNSGQMAGWNASDFCPDPEHRGWRLPGGFLPSLEVGGESEALGINEQDKVVGHSQTAAGDCSWPYQAVMWSESGTITNLGTLGGENSTAHALNDATQVVGASEFNDTCCDRHAFLWLPEPAFGLPSGLNDLGTFGGDRSFAYGINDFGWIVGQAYHANGEDHAFLWVGGDMLDLNDLISPDSGWVLRRANDINNQRQIVGRGITDGQFRAFLLTPLPCQADLNDDCVVNAADLALLLGAWGPGPGNPADLNDDDVVNAFDLAMLLGAWGPCE
ncbi:MAG: hypothetical protein V3U60_03570 [Gammaproteobacteria bacterium]